MGTKIKKQGGAGATGQDAYADEYVTNRYIWSAEIDGTIPTGRIEYNNVTPANVTIVYIASTDIEGAELSALLGTIAIGDVLQFSGIDDESKTVTFNVTGAPTGDAIPVTHDNSNSDFVSPDSITFSVFKGAGAASLGFIPTAYTHDIATADADPTTGKQRFDNTTYASITQIFISDISKNGNDLTKLYERRQIGDLIYIQQADDATKFAFLEISGALVDATTYFKIPVTFIDAGSNIDDAAEVAILYEKRAGAVNLGDLVFEVNAQTGTTYTLLDADHGKLVTLDNASAIALSVDTGLRSDFACSIMQKGAGQVTIGGTALVNNADGFTVTEKQFVTATIQHLGSDVFVSDGRLVA